MELEEFATMVEQAVSTRSCVLAFLHCEVAYSGRAETHLPPGERILLIKADRAVLIHQPEGSTPVNYMKPGVDLQVERKEDILILHAHHPKEKSWMDITVDAVHSATSRWLDDGHALDLAGNERDMSDWIRDHPESIGEGFTPLSREEQTDVGFIDVYGHDKKGRIIIVECKRVTASLQAVDQLRRYVERVMRIKGTKEVSGVIAAPGITPNAREMLASWGYRFCQVEPPKRLERWGKDQKRLGEF